MLKIYIDGAARGNPGPAGVGVVLSGVSGSDRRTLSRYLGRATNNVAESCALILALQQALQLGKSGVTVFSDSELLTRQVTGAYRVRNERLQWLHVLIQHLIQGFERFEIQHIPRRENRQADRLANQAITEALRKQPVSKRKAKSVQKESTPHQPTFF